MSRADGDKYPKNPSRSAFESSKYRCLISGNNALSRLKTLRSRIGELDTRRARPAPKTAEPFYSSRPWRELLEQIFQARGRRCEDPRCERPRGPWRRIYGDHVVELQDEGAKLDPANVMLRCASCHTRKTAEERAKRQAAIHAPD